MALTTRKAASLLGATAPGVMALAAAGRPARQS
jgi:hypothetical protein